MHEQELEFSSLIDCFVEISETIWVVWFSVRFSSFRCISNYCVFQEKLLSKVACGVAQYGAAWLRHIAAWLSW
jgi:hypothetical protein